jgi:hypothetical protein
VVAIVAASKFAIAFASRSRRSSIVGRDPVASSATSSSPSGSGAHQPLADALTELAGRHPRERDQQ